MIQIVEVYHKGTTYLHIEELDAFGKIRREYLLTQDESDRAESRAKKFFKTVPRKDYDFGVI